MFVGVGKLPKGMGAMGAMGKGAMGAIGAIGVTLMLPPITPALALATFALPPAAKFAPPPPPPIAWPPPTAPLAMVCWIVVWKMVRSWS